MCAKMSENREYIISGSEDGNVYVWNLISKYVPSINPMYFR